MYREKSLDLAYYPEDEKVKFSWEWYDPPEDSPPVNFFENTSLHGLHYIGQRKRHICERIFWAVAFLAAVVCATWLIWSMWSAYLDTPIVTVFSSNEKTLNQIPFPAVTLCNVNNIKKSKLEELKRKADEQMAEQSSNDTFLATLAALLDVFHICESTKPLTERFVNSTFRNDYTKYESLMKEMRDDYRDLIDPITTLRNASQSCGDMIRLCLWLDGIEDCSNIFQEIETDYGYCCTFNTIPLSLLMKSRNDVRDDPQRLEEWEKEHIHYDNVMFEDETMDRKYPLRQLYPGRSAGLSLFLNPDLDDYYCTNTDSKGFVVALNVPLDFPRMKDNGIAIRTNSEVFISVRPEVTMSDDTIKQFSLDNRRCYFSGEKHLEHYSRYTTSNCMNECITHRTLHRCGCIRYFMPSDDDEKLCSPIKYNCTEEVRANITRSGIADACDHCLPTCTEIEYHTEVTTLQIRDEQVANLLSQIPEYSDIKNVSILHIYFNVDSTYPRLRTEATTVISLISNAGGLLGLCMGFSMLSLLEIVYHATLRLCCNFYRDHSKLKHGKNNLDDVETIATVTNFNSSTRKRNNGFLSKVFHVDTSVETEKRSNATANQLKRTKEGKSKEMPHSHQTSFKSNSQRTCLKEAW